jgi:protein-S-isoprenylcysteine O-methyltransferase Ste14
MNARLKSWLLVIGQFSAIFLLVRRAEIGNFSWLGYGLLCSSLLLGIWSVGIFKIRQLTVFPEPKTQFNLVESGPYRYMRHPMYTAVLMAALGLAIESHHWLNWLIFSLLVCILLLKISHEEKLLMAAFPAYKNYCQRTKKLIPGVY